MTDGNLSSRNNETQTDGGQEVKLHFIGLTWLTLDFDERILID